MPPPETTSEKLTVRRGSSSVGPSPRRSNLAAAAAALSSPSVFTSSKSNQDTQTELSIFPPLQKLTSLGTYHEKLQAQEMTVLGELRDQIKECMASFGGSIYDLFALKDVLLRMQDSLPGAPITDVLLVSSKLYRRGSEVAHLMGTFFQIVFSEDFVDKHFHFTEMRFLQKEVAQLRKRNDDLQRERDEMKDRFDALGDSAKNHEVIVDQLESTCDVLEERGALLEDQMALLFQQLADDFTQQNEIASQQTLDDLNVQENLAAVRATFSQSIDTLQHRLKFFQVMLGEIQEEAAGFVVTDQHGGIKSKIKALEVHVNNIVTRFGAVREGLLNTAQDLTNALMEKRKALNFSMTHLKLYDVQNHKLRQARAQMHDLRQQLTALERTVNGSFATGSYVKVDRGGALLITPPTLDAAQQSQRAGGGGGGGGGGVPLPASASVSKHAVKNIKELLEKVRRLQGEAVKVTATLNTEDEQRAMLHAISTATVPSAKRSTIFNPATAPAATTGGGAEGDFGAAAAGAAGGALTITDAMSKAAAAEASEQQQQQFGVTQQQYTQLREDFAVKMTFLKEVYEERIEDLEAKVERLQKRVKETALTSGNEETIQFLKQQLQVQQQRMSAATAGSSGSGGSVTLLSGADALSGTMGEQQTPSPSDGSSKIGEQGNKQQQAGADDAKNDTEARERWQASRNDLLAGERLDKQHDALSSLDEIKAHTLGQASSGGTAVAVGSTTPDVGSGEGEGGGAKTDGKKKETETHAFSADAASAGTTHSFISPLAHTTSVESQEQQQQGQASASSARVTLPQTFSTLPSHRTDYSRDQQQRNAEVLRTLRKITK